MPFNVYVADGVRVRKHRKPLVTAQTYRAQSVSYRKGWRGAQTSGMSRLMSQASVVRQKQDAIQKKAA